MVRKGIVSRRVGHGIIPSKEPGKDRARTVHLLFRIFKNRLPVKNRVDMIKLSRKVLVIGERDTVFSGKDPYISGIAVFVFCCKKYSVNNKCPITYNQIRASLGHFAAAKSFTSMLKQLSKISISTL